MSLLISTPLMTHILGSLPERMQGSCALSIWGGDVLASINDPVTEDHKHLVEFAMPSGVFGEPYEESDRLAISALPVGGQLGLDEGVATFFRLYDAEGVPLMQGTCGPVSSDSDVELSDVNIDQTKLITIESMDIHYLLT